MRSKVVLTLDQLRRRHPGGIGTYVRGLVRGLQELIGIGELDFDLGGLAPRGPSPDPLNDLALNLRCTPFGERLTTRLWAHRALGVPRDAAVLHATSMAGPYGGGARGAVHSVIVHDVLWRDLPEFTTRRGVSFHESRLQRIVAQSDLRVLVTSSDLAHRLADEGVVESRLHVVRLGVDAAPVASELLGREQLFDQLRLHDVVGPLGRFTLVVGTVQPRKNLAGLIKAHREARVRVDELGPLVLAGERGWGDVDVDDAVVLGAVSAELLASLYAHCRISAYVPFEEGWGLPPVEALAAGRPVVVASTVPSVSGSPYVLTVDPHDHDAMVSALVAAIELVDDDDAREARRASVAHFSWANCARDHWKAWS